MQTNRESNRMQDAKMREEELSNLQMRLANKIRAEKEARSEMERLRQELYSRFYITWPVLKPVFWSSQKS